MWHWTFFCQVYFTRKSLLTVYFETIKIVIKKINQDFSYVFRKPFRTLIVCVLYIPFSHSYFTNSLSLRKSTMLHTKWAEPNVTEGDIYFTVRARSDKSKGTELGSSSGHDERTLTRSSVPKIFFNLNFSSGFLLFIIWFFSARINLQEKKAGDKIRDNVEFIGIYNCDNMCVCASNFSAKTRKTYSHEWIFKKHYC